MHHPTHRVEEREAGTQGCLRLEPHYLERGPLDDEMVTYFILNSEPVVIPDATTDIHTLYHKKAASEGVGSILAVPLLVKGEPIGLL